MSKSQESPTLVGFVNRFSHASIVISPATSNPVWLPSVIDKERSLVFSKTAEYEFSQSRRDVDDEVELLVELEVEELVELDVEELVEEDVLEEVEDEVEEDVDDDVEEVEELVELEVLAEVEEDVLDDVELEVDELVELEVEDEVVVVARLYVISKYGLFAVSTVYSLV